VYKDKAIIYVNAIEKSRGNQSVTATKITFANDLLNSNPECLELNEYIKEAQKHMAHEDYERASQILDEVIQGCKYLVSQSKTQETFYDKIFTEVQINDPWVIVTASFIVIMTVTIVLTIRIKKSNKLKEEE